jgi:GT2 family glycosyltransferase
VDHPELIAGYEAALRGARSRVELIVVDDASEPRAAGALWALVDRWDGIYARNETRRGFAAASNQGLAAATGTVVLFLNSDVEADPGFLDAVAREVGPGVVRGASWAVQEVGGQSVGYLEGWCLAARRRLWLDLGGWDASTYRLPYWEDVDLCWRAARSGYRLEPATWPVRHLGGRTTGGPGADPAQFERNRARFAARLAAAGSAPCQPGTTPGGRERTEPHPDVHGVDGIRRSR